MAGASGSVPLAPRGRHKPAQGKPREQISLSKDVNGPGTTAPFTSGAEHRTSLCLASLSAPSALYGISVRRLTGLTSASFPRDLAIPQLLLSSACAKLLTMKANGLTVFLHRGLSPRSFTPMSGAPRRCTEWRPRDAARQFGSHGGAAIGELNR